MHEIAVQTQKLTKRFEADYPAVRELDLNVRCGEILALLGPSGCGKTTTLRLIAGFERPDGGKVIINGQQVAGDKGFTPPEERGIGMVFQDYALFPHLNIFDNVAFGLHKQSTEKIQDTVLSMLKLVGLEEMVNRFPHELSGGQRQRIALARALAPRPFLLLLDEPFSNLDADLRMQMREEVRVILKGIKATAIFVTHDQEEALYIGDRVAVLNKGNLEQIGTPEEIFHHPETRFISEFMGNTDFLPGIVKPNGIETEVGLIPQIADLPLDTPVELALRADDVTFTPDKNGNSMILARHFRGAMNIYRLRLPSGRLLHAFESHTNIMRPGTPIQIKIDPGHPLTCFHQENIIATKTP